MDLFHQPINKKQIAYTLGMCIAKLRSDMIIKEIIIGQYRRLSPKEAEDVVVRMGYDPTDLAIIQRAEIAQAGKM